MAKLGINQGEENFYFHYVLYKIVRNQCDRDPTPEDAVRAKTTFGLRIREFNVLLFKAGICKQRFFTVVVMVELLQ